MFKFSLFLWIGLTAWNLHISQAKPKNNDDSKDALQDTPTYSLLLSRLEEERIRMENQRMELHTKLHPWMGLRQIGSRTFVIGRYIDNDVITFNQAYVKCRQLGGHLASIQSQEEFDNILRDPELQNNSEFWLATNDQAVEGHYVSIVSNRTAPFLKWKIGEPSDKDHTKNCVALSNSFMFNADCNERKSYICQKGML